MKQLVHNIEVSVFEKNPDRLPDVCDALHRLLSVDFKKEKADMTHDQAEGFEQKTIHILSFKTYKKRHNWLLLETVFNHLSDREKEKLYEQRDSRLNNQGYFYFRLHKEALLEDKYRLTEGGNCFHFKIKLAAFPNNRENAMKSLKMLLQKL
jgi:RNA binding exosome subunit